MAGPLGAIAGGIAGAIAGVFRDVTGKHVAQAFLEAPEAEQRRMLQQAGFLLLGGAGGSAATCASSSGDQASASSAGDQPGLTAEQLLALGSAPAGAGEPVCVLCMGNAVQGAQVASGESLGSSECANLPTGEAWVGGRFSTRCAGEPVCALCMGSAVQGVQVASGGGPTGRQPDKKAAWQEGSLTRRQPGRKQDNSDWQRICAQKLAVQG